MICLDFDKILNEICWQLPDGIFDIQKDDHLDMLRKVLLEQGAEPSQADDAIFRLKEKRDI